MIRLMKKLCIVTILLGAVLAVAFLLLTSARTHAQTTFIVPSTHEVKDLKITARERLYVGYPHVKGWYLDKGHTAISFNLNHALKFTFALEEELQLIGLHVLGGEVYLIFIAEYMPERGFLVFRSDKGSFVEIPLPDLPAEIAFANIGTKGTTTKNFLSVRPLPEQPPDEFYDTATAWLWSQMNTGDAVLSQGLNRSSVNERWKKWGSKIASIFEVP